MGRLLKKKIIMNAKLVDSNFFSNGSDNGDGNLELNFSNGIVLELCINVNANGVFCLRSPYTDGQMMVKLFIKKKLAHTFFITKTCSKIKENGFFIDKYTRLKYWIYARARRNERKNIINIIKKNHGKYNIKRSYILPNRRR